MTFPNILFKVNKTSLTDNALSQIALNTIQNFSGFENKTINTQNQVCFEMINSLPNLSWNIELKKTLWVKFKYLPTSIGGHRLNVH